VQLSSRYAPSAFTESGLPSRDDVRTDWTVGLSLSVPIFVGGRIRGTEIAARGGVRQAQARLDQAREGAALDAATSQDDLAAAQEVLTSSAATVTQAEQAYDIAALRYQNGLTTLVELLDTRLAWDQAVINRAQAARDVQVARARLALLPLLPLPAQTALPATTAGTTSSVPNANATSGANQPAPETGTTSMTGGAPVMRGGQ
jgi:outer membrane protein TolC